ncbi:uncharacterized protein LOC106774413 [Vigna radiata var. radiata]|uniref:Uncharacterized protein LOC106774413 n=1 Tax=Vigna radiata var. radiata TaxID=3916 RepID=A0A1S3VFN4_VIGRR|nr:uncharacterized protein LOC106774413 [Vigna radiata var. radiata]
MDRKWMFASRLSKEYEDGVKEFCRFAVEHAENPSRIICPCLKCCYSRVMSVDELEEHLICNGIDKSYSCWTRHGENRKNHIDKDFHDNTSYTPKETKTTYKLDEVEEIANVIKEDMRDCPQTFDRLTTDAKTPLYNCVRGMRFGVGHKNYFPSKKRHTHHELDNLIAQMKDLNERMTRMENEIILLRKIGTSNAIEEADIGVNSSQESCTFVAWPINRIQVVDEDSTQSKKKRMNNTNECVASKKKCQGKMIIQHTPCKQFHPNFPEWCNFLSSYLKLKPLESFFPMQMEKNLFGLDDHKEIVNRKNIEEVINYARLSATTISIYIRYLYQNFVKLNDKAFFFLSPQITIHELSMKDGMQKIVTLFLDNGVIDKFVLAPINISQHWVLLGINIKLEIIHYLDPMAVDINMRQELKKLFDMVIQTYRAQIGYMVSKSKSNNIKWTSIKCPKQSNDNDCGYYVCRYMKEIITYCEGGKIPTNYFSSCRSQQYCDNQIIEVMEDWCLHVISTCL